MTTGEAIRDVRFWLDQSADWFNTREIVVALNRAVEEWVLSKYEAGLSTERNRRELGRLIPAPIVGAGVRMVLGSETGYWLVAAITAEWKDSAGNWLGEEPVKPVGFDQKARAKRSIFHRPTDSYPLYTQQKQTNGTGEFFEILSTTPPDRTSIYYIVAPPVLTETNLTYVWEFIPPFAFQQIKQIAVRMLLEAVSPDYSSQVQVEEPKSMAPAIP